MLNNLSRCFINLIIKSPPQSVRMYLGAPYWKKKVVATAWTIVFVFKSGMGTAMQYLLKLSCIVRMCLFQFRGVDNFPTASSDIFSKGSIFSEASLNRNMLFLTIPEFFVLLHDMVRRHEGPYSFRLFQSFLYVDDMFEGFTNVLRVSGVHECRHFVRGTLNEGV